MCDICVNEQVKERMLSRRDFFQGNGGGGRGRGGGWQFRRHAGACGRSWRGSWT